MNDLVIRVFHLYTMCSGGAHHRFEPFETIFIGAHQVVLQTQDMLCHTCKLLRVRTSAVLDRDSSSDDRNKTAIVIADFPKAKAEHKRSTYLRWLENLPSFLSVADSHIQQSRVSSCTPSTSTLPLTVHSCGRTDSYWSDPSCIYGKVC